MRILVTVLAAMLTWSSASVALAQWPAATYSQREWQWDTTVRITDRPGDDRKLPLIRDADTNLILFDSETATDLETGPGFDLRFLRQNDYAWAWDVELSYHDWEIMENVTSPNGIDSFLFTPIAAGIHQALGPAVDNVQFDSFLYDYESEIFSVELNARKTVRPGLTVLAGPRFIYIEEQLDVDIDGTFDLLAATVPFTQSNRVETKNPMFGFQIGSEVFVPISRQIFATGFIKAGGYGNTAENHVQQSITLDPDAIVARNRRSQGSFVGEVGGKVNYDVVPGMLAVYVGYEANWFDNIATAPTQFTGPGLSQVQMSGTTFIQSILLGGTLRR